MWIEATEQSPSSFSVVGQCLEPKSPSATRLFDKATDSQFAALSRSSESSCSRSLTFSRNDSSSARSTAIRDSLCGCSLICTLLFSCSTTVLLPLHSLVAHRLRRTHIQLCTEDVYGNSNLPGH